MPDYRVNYVNKSAKSHQIDDCQYVIPDCQEGVHDGIRESGLFLDTLKL